MFLCNHHETSTFPFSTNINRLHTTVGNTLKFYEGIKTAGYFYYIPLKMPPPTFILIQKWPDIPPVRIITSHSTCWFHIADLMCDFQNSFKSLKDRKELFPTNDSRNWFPNPSLLLNYLRNDTFTEVQINESETIYLRRQYSSKCSYMNDPPDTYFSLIFIKR